jgi:hypothetical protein
MATQDERIEQDVQDADDDERAEQQSPAAEELLGESEYSLEEAHRIERGSTRRHARGQADRELASEPEPDELGRRFLEDATEAPGNRSEEEEEEESVILPDETT